MHPLACRAMVAYLMVFSLVSCAIPVRPIAFVEPVPGRDGVYHFTPDKDQEPQVGPGIFAGLGAIAAFLPSPYRELLGMLVVGWIGEKRKQGADACHKQTIDGIEAAKTALPPESWKTLTGSLASTQDEKTKKLVWDMTP
jgi:hypothetical protein